MIDAFHRLEAERFEDLALSLYLPAGPALDNRYYAAALKDLEKEQQPGLDDRKQRALRRELGLLHRFIEELSPPGKPLCVLSCEPAGLFESFWLPDEVEAHLWIDERLHLEPFWMQVTNHPPAVAVLVDRERARIFTSLLGSVQEVATIRGEWIKRHKQGGWSDARYQRHEDEHSQWHLKAAVEWLARQDPNGKNRLYIGGPTEARALFKRDLPKPLQRAVVGEFAAPLGLSAGELADRLKSNVP
jgi:peptide chain release factor subunit 1